MRELILMQDSSHPEMDDKERSKMQWLDQMQKETKENAKGKPQSTLALKIEYRDPEGNSK